MAGPGVSRDQPAALARALTLVENEAAGADDLLAAIEPRLGRAHRVGVTGPPGAGKSTLTQGLVRAWRAAGRTVAVVAVDPTSPVSGGALLGDRIRMEDVALDDGVFIRSMATRGALGGLALATREVSDVLDAAGFDVVVIETVGVGQSELDIVSAADTTLVVLVPESGDGIQTLKSGLMEVADVFVVNKADRPGAERLLKEIGVAMHIRRGVAYDLGGGAEGQGAGAWQPPALLTSATTGEGIAALVEQVARHRAWLSDSGRLEAARQRRRLAQARDVLTRALRRWMASTGMVEQALEAHGAEIAAGRRSAYTLAGELVARLSAR